jgi:hypothetical protein
MSSVTETFLDHVKWLRRAAHAARADLLFADTMQALLRLGQRHLVLHPQFLMTIDGVIRRTPQLHDESKTFLGWLPYPSKAWPIAVDRLAFKRHAAAGGLPVPQLFSQAGPSLADVVIRRTHPSFEPHVRGPFRAATDQPLDPAEGEYYEQHVEGDALTVWFWNGQPICAELVPAPTVVGDGSSTLGDLLVRGADRGGQISAVELRAWVAECEALARYRGLELSSVLPSGARLVVGLGHGSSLARSRARRALDLSVSPEWSWMPIMRKAGQLFLAAVPEEMRPATLFTVNATVDSQGRAWLLDMDASPNVHPLTYAAMLTTLLAPETQPKPTLQQ